MAPRKILAVMPWGRLLMANEQFSLAGAREAGAGFASIFAAQVVGAGEAFLWMSRDG
jgi:hypothetical protein